MTKGRVVTTRSNPADRLIGIPTSVEPLEKRVLLSGESFRDGNLAQLTDADGTVIEVSLRGPGKGCATWDEAGRLDLQLSKTAADSSLTLNARGGADGLVKLGDVTVDGTLGSLSAGSARLRGSLSVDGSLERLELGGVNGAEVSARRFGSVTINGNGSFDLRANAARSIEVRGDLTRSELHFIPPAGATDPGLGELRVAGTMKKVWVNTLADIGSIETGAMIDTRVMAGIRYHEVETGKFRQVLPTKEIGKTFDFTGKYTIGHVSVRGVSGKTYAFTNSNIAAYSLGDIRLTNVRSYNSNVDFGVAGYKVNSVHRTFGGADAYKNSEESPSTDLVVGQLVRRLTFNPTTNTYGSAMTLSESWRGIDTNVTTVSVLPLLPVATQFGVPVARITGHVAGTLYKTENGLYDARGSAGELVLSQMELAPLLVKIVGRKGASLKVASEGTAVHVTSTSRGPEVTFDHAGLRGTLLVHGQPVSLLSTDMIASALKEANVEFEQFDKPLLKMTKPSLLIGRIYDDLGEREIHLTQNGRFHILDDAGALVGKARTLRQALLGDPGPRMGDRRLKLGFSSSDEGVYIHGLDRGGTAVFSIPGEVVLNIAGDLFRQPTSSEVQLDLKKAEVPIRTS